MVTSLRARARCSGALIAVNYFFYFLLSPWPIPVCVVYVVCPVSECGISK